MDLCSLVAAHLSATGRPAATDARAEERYYRSQLTLPRPSLRPLIGVATTAGLILLLIGAAQV
jgi:hypothetical protein